MGDGEDKFVTRLKGRRGHVCRYVSYSAKLRELTSHYRRSPEAKKCLILLSPWQFSIIIDMGLPIQAG